MTRLLRQLDIEVHRKLFFGGHEYVLLEEEYGHPKNKGMYQCIAEFNPQVAILHHYYGSGNKQREVFTHRTLNLFIPAYLRYQRRQAKVNPDLWEHGEMKRDKDEDMGPEMGFSLETGAQLWSLTAEERSRIEEANRKG